MKNNNENHIPGAYVPTCTAIILAGGSGKRLGASMPKQYLELEGRPILSWTLDAFERCPLISRIILTAGADWIQYIQEQILKPETKVSEIVTGGKERQDSVLQAVKAAEKYDPDLVLIHDGVRPFVKPADLARVIEKAVVTGAALLAVPVKDTIKKTSETDREQIETTLDRAALWAAQTPQVFSLDLIQKGLARASLQGVQYTDDAQLVEALGRPVSIVSGSFTNIKITTPEDMALGSVLIRGGFLHHENS